MTSVVVESAAGHGKRSGSSAPRLPDDDGDVVMVRRLEAWRREERDSSTRAILSNNIYKFRRLIERRTATLRIQQAVEARTPQKSRKTKPLQCHALQSYLSDKVIDDPDEMIYEAEHLYTHLFVGDVPQRAPLPDWILKDSWSNDDLTPLPNIDGQMLKDALQRMSLGKSCHDDHLVVEMLRECDHSYFALLADVFRARLLNIPPHCDDEAWATHCISLVPKKSPGLRSVKQFRPIALLPTLYKLYSIVLGTLAGPNLRRLRAPQFAFRASHQAHEVIFILRNLIEKGIEWDVCGGNVFILDGDISKAYDNTDQLFFAEAAVKRGVPKMVVAGMVREIRKSKTVVKIKNLATAPIPRERSLIQGDPEAPNQFNLALDVLAEQLCETCQTEKLGIQLVSGGPFYPIILFADNCWLLASEA